MSLPVANVLQPLIDVADGMLRWFHYDLGIGWGWAIILLTIVVRAGLIPLTYKQLKSMQRMQTFQPEMKQIQEKYKDDSQKKNEAMMRFFKENKINPLASCLPLVLQIPFFIALFYALQDNALEASIKATGEHFLFIDSLVGKPTGVELAILVVLYVGSQLGSSLATMTPTMDPTQRKIMLALPIFFVFFIINFPAGLLVYWITTNMWTLGQSLAMRKGRMRHAEEMAVAASSNGDSGSVPKKAPPPPPRQKKKRSGRRR